MYTICLDMSWTHCLVVGMGKVGMRKLTSLLAASPLSVLVLDPKPLSKDAQQLCEHPCVRYEARAFTEDALEGCFFVVAATDDLTLNSRIALLCRDQEILCNCVTTPREGTVIMPAIVEHNGITCAITTHGASPALSKVLRQELAIWLEEKASPMLLCIKRLRPHILQTIKDEKTFSMRQKIFHDLVASELAGHLRAGDRAGCITLLQALLPASLHHVIDEVLHELV